MTSVFSHVQRVRPQDCSVTGYLGHPRFLELFEAAFLECWRSRFGALHDALGPDRRLVVTDVSLRILDGVTVDAELQVDVTIDRVDESSLNVHYDALVSGARVAEATVQYVCIDTEAGRPTPLPAH